jgi:predicted DNA-binding protein with PD1-like motif
MSTLSATQGRTLICRLKYESDLLDSIKELSNQNNFASATFSAIGAVKKATISFYYQEEKRYREMTIDKPLEVLVCCGNVGKLRGETLVHGHITLSDAHGQAWGGHLTKGTEVFAMELVMTELRDIKLVREFDTVTGLNLVKIPPDDR